MCERGAEPQLGGAVVPRQQVEAVLAYSFEQCMLDCLWSGAGSGPLDRRIAPRRRLRVGVTEPVAGSNSPSWRTSIRSPNRSRTIGFVDGRRRQDSRAGRVPGDLADREPFASRKRRSRVEPEAAPAD